MKHGKRKFGTPTGNTPGKPDKKSVRLHEDAKFSSRKTLFVDTETTDSSRPVWSKSEVKELVKYVALYNECEGWPTHKHIPFWQKCAKAIAVSTGLPLRSGNACRMKVMKCLRKDFKSINEAEEAYNIDYFDKEEVRDSKSVHMPATESLLPGDIINNINDYLPRITPQQRIGLATSVYSFVAENDFQDLKHFIPTDYIELSLHAASHLKRNGKDNVIYDLCKCLGLMRDDGSSARMDIQRMPFGLIAYNCKFFASDDASNLHVPDDYMQWMESMYTYFGNSWASLHLGPMWSYAEMKEGKDKCVENSEEQRSVDTTHTSNIIEEALAGVFNELTIPETFLSPSEVATADIIETPVASPITVDTVPHGNENNLQSIETPVNVIEPSTLWSGLSLQEKEILMEADESPVEIGAMFNVMPEPKSASRKRKTMDAKVNVAGPSARTIRRHIADSGFGCDTQVQVEALEKAKQSNPDGRWFIKADATDMQMGLRESMQGKWTGDCDMGDGELQKTKKTYDEQLVWIRGLGLNDRKDSDKVVGDLHELTSKLSDDANFLKSGLKSAKDSYEVKRKQRNVPEQTLFALAWTVEGFEKLLEMNVKLTSNVNNLIVLSLNQVKEVNIPKKLSTLRKDLGDYVKGMALKKRDPASHLLVFMISDELRSQKPYAIPIRALPYKGITDDGLRKLTDEVRESMRNVGMIPVGFSSDGEFNSLRTMGRERPISVIQLMMNARAKARSMSVNAIEKCVRPVKGADGNIYPQVHHVAVPMEDVKWLYEFMYSDGSSVVPFERAINILRRKYFPFFYDPHPWVPGKDETLNDALKSLMAHYLYRQYIKEYAQKGVNFQEHLYVPEIDTTTGEYFHEREDHNHVLKRITACTRAGSVPNVDMHAFVECLHSPNSGLTYTALTGQHKQSVPDCEKMFSRGVLEFFEENNFPEEARFVSLVRNWHKANDGRGLTEETRRLYNLAMLDFILEDWMPWYWFNRDYSVMDVNRPIKGIKGFSREIIVALVANIESKEQRRLEYQARLLPPEHPRASATDDLEGFFATLHQMLGRTFDHKTFVDNYRKIQELFVKRINTDLPFHYWTGVNERFNVGPMKSFNEPTDGKIERLDRISLSRRADPGIFVANRASLPQRGSLSVRAQFHAKPEALPP